MSTNKNRSFDRSRESLVARAFPIPEMVDNRDIVDSEVCVCNSVFVCHWLMYFTRSYKQAKLHVVRAVEPKSKIWGVLGGTP